MTRPGATLAAVNDKIYFVGSSLIEYSGIIDVLDTTSNTWSVMNLDPPRITIRTVGVEPKYLVLAGGFMADHNLYRHIVIVDVTTNEQYTIPYPTGWSLLPTLITMHIHMLKKVVAYVPNAWQYERDILIIDPATKSVDQISSDGIRQAVTNGTHLLALTAQGAKLLDVEAKTWHNLTDLPIPFQPTLTYMRAIDSIVFVRGTNPMTFHVYPFSGNASQPREYSFSGTFCFLSRSGRTNF